METTKIRLGLANTVTAKCLTSDAIRDMDISGVGDPRLRAFVRDIVGNEAFKRAVDFPSKSVLECNQSRVVKNANILAGEIRELPQIYNPGIVSAITYMAELMAPSENPELALAISRAWVMAVTIDDYCETSSSRWCELFDHVTNPDSTSPVARYMRFTLDAVRPFSSQTFVNIWRQTLLKAFLGGYLECRVAEAYPQGGCRSSSYLRQMSGYADFWGLTLSLLHPRLSFPENPKVWIDVLCDINTFLCDYNDAMSVYKEATDGADFVKNVVFQEGYREAFPRAVDRALTAADCIVNVVPPETRAIFERFLYGYGIFHLYSARYRMKELLPQIQYYDLDIVAA